MTRACGSGKEGAGSCLLKRGFVPATESVLEAATGSHRLPLHDLVYSGVWTGRRVVHKSGGCSAKGSRGTDKNTIPQLTPPADSVPILGNACSVVSIPWKQTSSFASLAEAAAATFNSVWMASGETQVHGRSVIAVYLRGGAAAMGDCSVSDALHTQIGPLLRLGSTNCRWVRPPIAQNIRTEP